MNPYEYYIVLNAMENFDLIKEFHRRVASYQAWYNIVRENSNKDFKSPWQIIKQLRPQTPIELVRQPPVMLDRLGPDYITKEELLLRGYDVPWFPFSGEFRFVLSLPN